MMKKTILVACLFGFGPFACLATAQGQVPPTAPRGSQGEIEEDLRLRGMPLRLVEELRSEAPKLVGREEGENGFRSRTPLLDKAKGRGRRVDLEALRRRKLAMFEEGAVFHDRLPFADPDPEPIGIPRKNGKLEAEDQGVALWKILSSVGLLAVSGIFAYVALKKSP